MRSEQENKIEKLEAENASLRARLGEAEKLFGHFRAMQAMAAAYVEPAAYVDRDGKRYPEPDSNHTDNIKQELRNDMAKAFANDMLYMLDGPEERAAAKGGTDD